MLPWFLVFSVFAFLDASYASSFPSIHWRPDLRRVTSSSRATAPHVPRNIVNNLPVVANSTIVPLVFSSDKESYYVLSAIGNVSLRLALDTASADLWVVSSDCSSSTCKLPKYPLGFESATFVSINSNETSFGVGYADGTSAQGFVAREAVSLGNLTVHNQALGLANSSNVTFTDQVSGILGLGFPRLSSISDMVVNATPFFATLSQNKQLGYPLFGLSLTRDASGSLAFGAIDGSVVSQRKQIEWHEVVPFAPFGSESNSSSYLQWVTVLESISVNGSAIAPVPTYPNQTMNASLALIDVGTPGIYGPYEDVSRIFSNIDSARLVNDDDGVGQWVVPCDTEETMAFNFGGNDFLLQPTDYMIGPASGNPNLCLSWPQALPPSSDGIDWQLGASFLRTVYSVYSFGINGKEPPMIGFYARSNATTLTQSPDFVSSFLANASATVLTTLPNFLVPTPTFSTPTYTFNTSVTATPGMIVQTGLANSSYTALLNSVHGNVSAIALVTPSPTVETLVVTDTAGHTSTSITTVSQQPVTLGVPAGWQASGATRIRSEDLRLTFCVFLGIAAFGTLWH